MFDTTNLTNREVLALATFTREAGDKAAEYAKAAAKVGDQSGADFHTGRQAAFLTVGNEVHRLVQVGFNRARPNG